MLCLLLQFIHNVNSGIYVSTEILFYSTIQSAQINEEFIRPSLPLHKYRVTILRPSSGLQAGVEKVSKVKELKVKMEVEEIEEPTPCHPHSP